MDGEPTNEPQPLSFYFGKGRHFRVVHVDGAFGGIGPNGRYINMTLYSERRAIPREQIHLVNEEGKLGELAQTVGREGVFRELEVCATMDPITARLIYEWLGEKIKAQDELFETMFGSSDDDSDFNGSDGTTAAD